MVELLLSTGKFADLLETTDHTGRTPLHVAAFRAPEVVCRALVAAGASAAVMDKRLNTPSELAGRMGRRNSKDYLLQVTQTQTRLRCDACRSRCGGVAQMCTLHSCLLPSSVRGSNDCCDGRNQAETGRRAQQIVSKSSRIPWMQESAASASL
jgi:hypothetical protein